MMLLLVRGIERMSALADGEEGGMVVVESKAAKSRADISLPTNVKAALLGNAKSTRPERVRNWSTAVVARTSQSRSTFSSEICSL